MLGVTHAVYSGEAMTIQLSRDNAERLAKIAKTTEKPYWAADDARSVQIDRADDVVTFAFSTGETVTVTTPADADFPRWRQLLLKLEQREDVALFVCLDPEHLAKFTKVIDTDRPVRMTMTLQGPGRSVLIKIGASFVGAIMPVRLPEESSFQWPEWLNAAGEDTQQTVTRRYTKARS